MNKNTLIGGLYILISVFLVILNAILLILGDFSIVVKLIITLALILTTWNLSNVLTTARIMVEFQKDFDDDDDEIE